MTTDTARGRSRLAFLSQTQNGNLLMGCNKRIVLSGILAVLVLVGCASPPERILSANSPTYAALPNGYDPLSPTQRSAMYAAATSADGENAVRHLERKLGRPLNILSLSGGGQNGAFGAGFLKGWRESGRRPKFDAVGGVSTGALLATHALLGTPADDAKLEEMYLQITKDDIYNDIGIIDLLSGADSLRNTAPLRDLIAKHVLPAPEGPQDGLLQLRLDAAVVRVEIGDWNQE